MAPCRGMAEAFVVAADLFLILGAAICFLFRPAGSYLSPGFLRAEPVHFGRPAGGCPAGEWP